MGLNPTVHGFCGQDPGSAVDDCFLQLGECGRSLAGSLTLGCLVTVASLAKMEDTIQVLLQTGTTGGRLMLQILRSREKNTETYHPARNPDARQCHLLANQYPRRATSGVSQMEVQNSRTSIIVA